MKSRQKSSYYYSTWANWGKFFVIREYAAARSKWSELRCWRGIDCDDLLRTQVKSQHGAHVTPDEERGVLNRWENKSWKKVNFCFVIAIINVCLCACVCCVCCVCCACAVCSVCMCGCACVCTVWKCVRACGAREFAWGNKLCTFVTVVLYVLHPVGSGKLMAL